MFIDHRWCFRMFSLKFLQRDLVILFAVGIQVGQDAWSLKKNTLLGEFCVVIVHYLAFGFFMVPFQLGVFAF